tara:strand:+ start:16554 stop:17309 length:756 start_codon:yes stop_codon:yes gene_type:complete
VIALTNWKRTYNWLIAKTQDGVSKLLKKEVLPAASDKEAEERTQQETALDEVASNVATPADDGDDRARRSALQPKRFAISICIAFLSTAFAAEARPRPKRSTASFEANKTFGLGLMVGVPSGISGKYYLSKDTALDFGLGLYGRYGRDRDNRALHLHVDHLWHPVVLAKPDAFWLPLYFGVGARLLDHRRDRDFSDDTHFGVRAPLGILMDFTNVPLDIFLELALVVDIIHDGNHGYSDLNLSLGLRYYFN